MKQFLSKTYGRVTVGLLAVLILLIVCLLAFKSKKVTNVSSDDVVEVETLQAEKFDSPKETESEEETSLNEESEEESSIVEQGEDSLQAEMTSSKKTAKKNSNKIEQTVIEDTSIPNENTAQVETIKQEEKVNKITTNSTDEEEEAASNHSNGNASGTIAKPTQLQVPEEDKYYQENATVISMENADLSKSVLTEKQVIEFLAQRGFSDYPITYEYEMGGAYDGEKTITGDDKIKHPIYQTFYMSEKEELWTIFVVNGVIFANPVSFNLESTLQSQLLVSETDKLVSYSNKTNNFYVTIPKKSAAIVMTIEKIDAEALDKLTVEEIGKYEKE